MFQTHRVSNVPIREPFAITPYLQAQQTYQEPPIDLWIGYFWRSVHIMAITYNPTDELTKKSIACFYQSLAGIIPSAELRRIMNRFIEMDNTIKDSLVSSKSLSSFFTVHSEVYDELTERPHLFFSWALINSTNLFIWSFLFHTHWNILQGIPVESYNALKMQYDPSTISKKTWGNPTWICMHFYTSYGLCDHNFILHFKAFLSCLRYCLPCPKCRANLEKNLRSINIDEYINTPDGLFRFTFDLHNIVNKEIHRSTITLEEAKRLYAPYSQPLVQQNMNLSRFM